MMPNTVSIWARAIQVAYCLFLLGLFWALVNDGLRLCIGRACTWH